MIHVAFHFAKTLISKPRASGDDPAHPSGSAAQRV